MNMVAEAATSLKKVRKNRAKFNQATKAFCHQKDDFVDLGLTQK